MEAHPPYRLPEGGAPVRANLALDSPCSGSDHPPSPLPRRKGEEKKSSLWHQRPLWTPPPGSTEVRANLALGDTPRPLPKGGALWTPALSTRTCYAFPFAPPRHCECSEAVWGGGGPLYFCFGESSLKSGSDHPPGPLPRRKGEEKKSSLWRHILHTACQRAAPSGLPLCRHQDVRRRAGGHPQTPAKGRRPLDSRFADQEVRRGSGGHPQTPGEDRRKYEDGLGDTPRPLPKGWRPLDSRFQHEDVLSISLEDIANVV